MYKTVLSCAAASIALALAPAAGAGEVPVIDSANIVTPPVPTAPPAPSGGGGGGLGSGGTTTPPSQVTSFDVNALSPPQMAQAAALIQEVLTSNSLTPQGRRALQQQLAQMQQQMGR